MRSKFNISQGENRSESSKHFMDQTATQTHGREGSQKIRKLLSIIYSGDSGISSLIQKVIVFTSIDFKWTKNLMVTRFTYLVENVIIPLTRRLKVDWNINKSVITWWTNRDFSNKYVFTSALAIARSSSKLICTNFPNRDELSFLKLHCLHYN